MIDVKTLVCCQELFDGDKENLNVVLLFVANKHPTIRMDEKGCSLTIVLFFPPKHFWREKKSRTKMFLLFQRGCMAIDVLSMITIILHCLNCVNFLYIKWFNNNLTLERYGLSSIDLPKLNCESNHAVCVCVCVRARVCVRVCVIYCASNHCYSVQLLNSSVGGERCFSPYKLHIWACCVMWCHSDAWA